MKLGFTLIVLFNLTGCALNRIEYKAPTEGPTAIIKFVNNSPGKLAIAFYEESRNCGIRRHIKDINKGEESPHMIYANKDLTFQYIHSFDPENKYCRLNLRFTPKSGNEYIFYANANTAGCLWNMVEYENGKYSSDIPLENKSWKIGWDENGQFCEN